MLYAKIDVLEDGTMEIFEGSETPESTSWVFVEPPVHVPHSDYGCVLRTLFDSGYGEVRFTNLFSDDSCTQVKYATIDLFDDHSAEVTVCSHSEDGGWSGWAYLETPVHVPAEDLSRVLTSLIDDDVMDVLVCSA